MAEAVANTFEEVDVYDRNLRARLGFNIRSDVCLCGGLTNAKKIAALAEAYYAQVAPYNPLSPVSTAACVQLRFIATSATAPQAEQG